MKDKISKLYAIALAATIVGCQGGGGLPTTTPIENGVEYADAQGGVKVQFYAPATVKTVKWIAEGKKSQKSLVVDWENLPKLDIKLSETNQYLVVKSSDIIVAINKDNKQITYLHPDSTNWLTESGNPDFKQIVAFTDTGYTVCQDFQLTPDEGIFGLGQHQENMMNYRGQEVILSQSNVNAINPVLVSTQNYAIFWDNYSLTKFNNTNQNTMQLWSEMGNCIEYYFMGGQNADQVISNYRNLTGKAPLLPRWAFGYWQSKERYKTQQETESVAQRYRKEKIPIDVIVQDWEWWEPGKWSGMEFDLSRFPNAKAMVDKLHQLNTHAIISVWPSIGIESPMYTDMMNQGLLYAPLGWGNFRYIDAYNPLAMDVYCKYLYDNIYSLGFDGWWHDSTEPDVMNALTKESHLYEMKRMQPNYLGSFTRYLNPYVLAMLDKSYQKWREQGNQKRACILTRSAFAGLQRDACITWSGDIGASWEIYQAQIKAGLNYCYSGLPWWTFDVGGFVIGSYEGVFTYGAKDPAFQELYTRMFQFCTFCPIFRSHGSDAPREIWEIPQYKNVLIKFDNLRYRLMPYIYSIAAQTALNNSTMMRALPMDFANDKNTYSIGDQYMFGNALLINPVTEYMYNTPPQISHLVPPEVFKTNSGEKGITTKYYDDINFSHLTKETIEPQVDAYWYTGRPEYVTDSLYSIRWEGKIVAPETGKYQFQIKSFDSRMIILNGDTLDVILAGNEPYYEFVNLEAGKEYDIVCQTVNHQTGAARFRLFWKTPSDFAKEGKQPNVEKTRQVYLPQGSSWIDFFTGKIYQGGQTITLPAPIETIPILAKAGSILPMGPYVQYADENVNAPLEIRIYPGADGKFTLYYDEGDNYNYEDGKYATIDLNWNDASKTLSIAKRKGSYNGMANKLTFNIVVVKENTAIGIEPTKKFDKTVEYTGNELEVKL